METATPSRTAMATSLMRALHTRVDPLRLIDDSWGERLLAPARAVLEARMRELNSGVDTDAQMRAGPAYPNVIVRARFCEDALQAAVARGVRQYVIVGGGFDSFTLRRPDWARDVEIVEVDHPATQGYKLDRFRDCGVPLPSGASFVDADLGAEPLGEALRRSPFRSGEPAFFAWLGVTMYLTREANLATFREIGRVGAATSELVFSYANAKRFDGASAPSPRYEKMREMVKSVGEPFVSGFDPATIGAELTARGLRLVEDLGTDELIRRYDPRGLNGMRAGALGRIARAVVG
jgi:methyltransferase (TIGR00027 family)